MAQQTAVEWLIIQVNSDCLNSAFIKPELVEQAKQIEKEQIIKAASVVLWKNSSNSTESAEQYYNETYCK